MTYRLAYGKHDLSFSLPEGARVDVIQPHERLALENSADAVRDALRAPIGARPIAELARGASKVGIIVNDITRATPTQGLLEAIRDELPRLGDEQIEIFVATGTHRPVTVPELDEMLGRRNRERYRVVQNDARDAASHRSVGVSSRGNDIRLHSELLACDVKVLTGFIEPHFFAGFSGGGKALMPGMAALDTVMTNHNPRNMDDPRAVWGSIDSNPIMDEVREAAAMVGGCFLLNVALGRNKNITAVFAGDVVAAHDAGCAFVRSAAMVAVPHRYDVVVTSNSGHPLDLNLYQSVKGMSAAAQIVKPGGAIVIAAACWDGVPEHGEYGRLLRSAGSPAELLRTIRAPQFRSQDMWQAQLHAAIVERADVHIYSEGLSDEQIQTAFLTRCRSIEETVLELAGRAGGDAAICVLPEGPLTIPYVDGT